GGVAAADRDRNAPVGVLIEYHVAGTRVGERSRRDGVVALRPELELETRAGLDLRLFELLASEIELHVPEPVYGQDGTADARRTELRGRDVESRERVRGDRRAKLRESDAEREMRGSRREQIAPVECPRDALERVVGVRQLVGLGDAAELVAGRKQQAVVRADVDPSFAVAQSESAPRRPDSRIDDGEVDSDRHGRKR